MPRLPIPGSDDGTWGDILNDFLNVGHNSDGTLKTSGGLPSDWVVVGTDEIQNRSYLQMAYDPDDSSGTFADLYLSQATTGLVDLHAYEDEVQLLMQAAPGQTDPLLKLHNENGNLIGSFMQAGRQLTIGDAAHISATLAAPTDGNGAYLYLYADANGEINVVSDPTKVQFAMTAETGQTDPLVALYDENGVSALIVNPNGNIKAAADKPSALALGAEGGDPPELYLSSGAAGQVDLAVHATKTFLQMAAEVGQTDPILFLQDENGIDRFSVSPDGGLFVLNPDDVTIAYLRPDVFGNAITFLLQSPDGAQATYYADDENGAGISLGGVNDGLATLTAKDALSQLRLQATATQVDPMVLLRDETGVSVLTFLSDADTNALTIRQSLAGQVGPMLVLQDDSGANALTVDADLALHGRNQGGSRSYLDLGNGSLLTLVHGNNSAFASLVGQDGLMALQIQAYAGQTNPLMALYDENGNAVTAIGPDGSIAMQFGPSSSFVVDPNKGRLYLNGVDGNESNIHLVNPDGVADVKISAYDDGVDGAAAVVVKAGTGQSDPMLALYDENGTLLFALNPDGTVFGLQGGLPSGWEVTNESTVRGGPGNGTPALSLSPDYAQLFFSINEAHSSNPSFAEIYVGESHATLSLHAATNQTDPLLSIQNEVGVVQFIINPDGRTVLTADGGSLEMASGVGRLILNGTDGDGGMTLYTGGDGSKIELRAKTGQLEGTPLLSLFDVNYSPLFTVSPTGRLGFNGNTPVAQSAAIANATDAASTQARLNDLLAYLRSRGDIAT